MSRHSKSKLESWSETVVNFVTYHQGVHLTFLATSPVG